MSIPVPYKVNEEEWFWRGPESLFRDFDGNGTQDETNAAAGTFWCLPVHIGSSNPVILLDMKAWEIRYGVGSRFQSMISKLGYKDLIAIFKGPVLNHSWMYYLTDECVTADDTPSAGYYTHTHDSSNAISNPPKTMEILRKRHNNISGEVVWDLYTGCTVIAYKEVGPRNGAVVIGEWTVHLSARVTGTALNTEPTYPNMDFYRNEGTLTWTKAAAAYVADLMEYEFNYKTNKRLNKTCIAQRPTSVISPSQVDISLRMTLMIKETDIYDDTQDDPHSDQNKDLILKISTDGTTRYFSYVFPNHFQDLQGEDWTNSNLEITEEIRINPHETGSKFQTIEVNDINDDRYET